MYDSIRDVVATFAEFAVAALTDPLTPIVVILVASAATAWAFGYIRDHH